MALEPEAEWARLEIGRLARDMLSGKLSYIEGARSIWRLASSARLDNNDPDLRTFVAIDSDTDELPTGAVRELWDAQALRKMQPDFDRAEKWAQEVGREACESLARRFGGSEHD